MSRGLYIKVPPSRINMHCEWHHRPGRGIVGRSNSSNPKFLIVISLVTPQLDFLKLAHIHGMLELSHKAKVEDAIILVGRLISYIKISKNKPYGIIIHMGCGSFLV
jgi:hypothetical protein